MKTTEHTNTVNTALLCRNDLVCSATRTDRHRHMVESFVIVAGRTATTRRYYASVRLATIAAEMEIESGRLVADATVRSLAEYVTVPASWERAIVATGGVMDLV